MALIHLIYVSSATAACDAAELEKILVASARNNAPLQLTGMLLYAQGNFMQVLEGEEAAIDQIYSRIVKDPRHTDVFVIEREAIEQRSFDQWSMGFRRLGATEALAHPAYAPFFERGFDAAKIGAHPGLALDMLKEFGLDQR